MNRKQNGQGHIRRAETLQELTRRNIDAIHQMEDASERRRTTGEKVADAFAATIGSWSFIIAQSVLLGAWMVLNVCAWIRHWDPYPFILLNLALSFQAAYAGPIIMMSQNRQSRLADRRNRLDLQINLLAEQENTEMLRLLRLLCEKLEIPVRKEASLNALEQETEPSKVVREIDRSMERKDGGGEGGRRGKGRRKTPG